MQNEVAIRPASSVDPLGIMKKSSNDNTKK